MKLKQQFLIRTAVRADVPALEQLIQRSVRQLQRLDYTSDQIEGARSASPSVSIHNSSQTGPTSSPSPRLSPGW